MRGGPRCLVHLSHGAIAHPVVIAIKHAARWDDVQACCHHSGANAGIKSRAKARLFCLRESAYFAAINATVMSSMRLEKPHSLSYQLSTFTRVPPMTRVWVAS
jgi:hypothetical protein